VTYLAEAGVSPKHAQELARHSDMRLTMQVYAHTELQALADSVGRLALPSGEKAPDNPLAALPRADLERLCLMLLEAVGHDPAEAADLVALRVALNFAPPGDDSGLTGTLTRKRQRTAGRRNHRKVRRLGRVETVRDGIG
jgi:hypothetical protein